MLMECGVGCMNEVENRAVNKSGSYLGHMKITGFIIDVFIVSLSYDRLVEFYDRLRKAPQKFSKTTIFPRWPTVKD